MMHEAARRNAEGPILLGGCIQMQDHLGETPPITCGITEYYGVIPYAFDVDSREVPLKFLSVAKESIKAFTKVWDFLI